MEFVNLTAHTINEVSTGMEIPTSGTMARVKTSNELVSRVDGCPIYATTFGEVEGLPEPMEGKVYIVSSLVLNAIPEDRTDVVAPGNLQRNEHGQPVGCMGFRR